MRAMFLTGLTIEDMKSRMETTRFWQPAFAEEAREATDNAEGHLLNRAWSGSVAMTRNGFAAIRGAVGR